MDIERLNEELMNNNFAKFPEFDNHEFILSASDQNSGLRCFIALHRTNLGSALGATRFWHYASEEDALRDTLRLSRTMTYKCALARIPYGGGKGVIMADEKFSKNGNLLKRYAQLVDGLKGRFYTGEDVGLNGKDVRKMASVTRYVVGKLPKRSDDPPYWTALGVFYAMQAALAMRFGDADMRGRKVAVKGLGKVGTALCRVLHQQGAKLIGADVNFHKVRRARARFPEIQIVSPEEIHRRKVDIFAPCALGNDFDKKTIPQLRCKVICGGANNQLATAEDGARLYSWGILYVPDYLANAGGLINVSAELNRGGYRRPWVERKVKRIKETTKQVLVLSRKTNKPTSEVADRLAESFFKKAARRT